MSSFEISSSQKAFWIPSFTQATASTSDPKLFGTSNFWVVALSGCPFVRCDVPFVVVFVVGDFDAVADVWGARFGATGGPVVVVVVVVAFISSFSSSVVAAETEIIFSYVCLGETQM